jgi:hypothetical protein
MSLCRLIGKSRPPQTSANSELCPASDVVVGHDGRACPEFRLNARFEAFAGIRALGPRSYLPAR